MIVAKTNRVGRKGQLFSGDITVASVLFILALVMVFFIWNSVSEQINSAENLRQMEKTASELAEQLVRTPGVPEDWTFPPVEVPATGLVDVPGLATEDRVINQTKAVSFMNLLDSTNSTNYDTNKHLLGLGVYDFYLNATYLDGRPVMVGGRPFEAGKKPLGASVIRSLFRTMVFNETVVRIYFVIWD